MSVDLHICMHIIYDAYVWSEESNKFPRTGVTNGYESLLGAGNQTHPSEEQRLLLITELSLQTFNFILHCSKCRIVSCVIWLHHISFSFLLKLLIDLLIRTVNRYSLSVGVMTVHHFAVGLHITGWKKEFGGRKIPSVGQFPPKPLSEKYQWRLVYLKRH